MQEPCEHRGATLRMPSSEWGNNSDEKCQNRECRGHTVVAQRKDGVRREGCDDERDAMRNAQQSVVYVNIVMWELHVTDVVMTPGGRIKVATRGGVTDRECREHADAASAWISLADCG